MKYDVKFKSLWKSASREESRYSLKGIKLDVEAGVLVATEGHILSVIDAKQELEANDVSCIIPIDAWKAAERLRKSRKAIPVYIRLEDARIYLYSGTTVSQIFDVVDGNFPNYEAVVPENTDDHKFAVRLSAELLLSLAESLTGDSTSSGVSLYVKSNNEAVLVSNNSDSYGIIMPMRDGVHTPPKAFWRKRGRGEKK